MCCKPNQGLRTRQLSASQYTAPSIFRRDVTNMRQRQRLHAECRAVGTADGRSHRLRGAHKDHGVINAKSCTSSSGAGSGQRKQATKASMSSLPTNMLQSCECLLTSQAPVFSSLCAVPSRQKVLDQNENWRIGGAACFGIAYHGIDALYSRNGHVCFSKLY